MKKTTWWITAVLTISILMISTFGTGASDRTDQIIEDMILYHGCYAEQADETVDRLLKELEMIDSKQGELWRGIMEYWNYVNTDMEVNLDSLPEDLPEDDSLCIVILGFELNDDGTMQDELLGRLETARRCAEQYPNAYVLCTGGGTAKANKTVTEAGLMGEWLLQQGLDPERLIIEDRSHTTAENAVNSYTILQNSYPQVNALVLVSSSYHIPWGTILFEAAVRKYAFENGTPAIPIVSNCAYPTVNEKYKESELLRWETGGMLQLIGEDDLARTFYMNYKSFVKPELPEE